MAGPAPDEPLRPLDQELRLGEPLGRGAMGSVYRARELSTGRELAVKVLHASTASAAQRFLREGQVTANLRHPGILQVYGTGTLKGRPCLCYELVPQARSFEQAVCARPDLGLPLLIEAARTLGAAHASGLVHRDVKSENMLVDAHNRLWVTDFGIVAGADLERLTRTGAWVGTPHTMAPEQFGARERVGPQTDVWALGVLLYWVLCGRYPFEQSASLIELAAAIAEGRFAPPSKWTPVAPAVEAVCLRALQRAPQARYADGAAFADALAAASGATPARPTRRRLVGAALLALGALGGIALWAAASARPVPPLAPARAPPPSGASATPSASLNPQAPEVAPPDPLEAVFAWVPEQVGRPCPEALLDPSGYHQAEAGFLAQLSALSQGVGSCRQVAQALLQGDMVRRDVPPALALLRHEAAEGSRRAQLLLVQTLAAEGAELEEVVWLGRMARFGHELPELRRLAQLKAAAGPGAASASAVWARLPGSLLRGSALALSESETEEAATRAETALVVDLALSGWQREESLQSDWELQLILDALGQRGSVLERALSSSEDGSRRWLGFCLKRGDAGLFTEALRRAAAQPDTAGLAAVVEEASEAGLETPAAGGAYERLTALVTPSAARARALCTFRGWGRPRDLAAGLSALRGLVDAEDYGAAVAAARALGRGPRLADELALLLRPGARAGDPESIALWAPHVILSSASTSAEREGARAQLLRATEGGSAAAIYAQARLLRELSKSPSDMEEARAVLARAVEAGSVPALRLLAEYELVGLGGPVARAEGLSHLEAGAQRGVSEAALRAGKVLADELGPGPVEPEASARARRLLRRALARGNASVELDLALLDLRTRGRVSQGRAALERLAHADPAGAAATALGKALCAEGRRAEAEPWLAGAATREPGGLRAYLDWLVAEERGPEAERFLKDGVARQAPIFLLHVARQRWEADPAAARRGLEQALARGRPEALGILGELLWRSGQREEAWAIWLQAERMGVLSTLRVIAESTVTGR